MNDVWAALDLPPAVKVQTLNCGPVFWVITVT